MISLDALIERYYTSVGRNTNMLIGMVIDDRGLVPNADLELYERFGGIILKRFSNLMASGAKPVSRVLGTQASPPPGISGGHAFSRLFGLSRGMSTRDAFKKAKIS